MNNPAQIIIDSIGYTPFQVYLRKQRINHPEKPVIGWTQRLKSYCWPSPSTTWDSTQKLLNEITNKLNTIESNGLSKSHNQEELLTLFQEICTWGGVRLPENNKAALSNEVSNVLQILDSGKVPGSSYRINSAWTKLYALMRPDSFIIYDSRVAHALIKALDPHMSSLYDKDSWLPYRNLGKIPGRAPSRGKNYINRWPNGYQRWEAQFSANLLANQILKLLNSTTEQAKPQTGGNRKWSLREVEAVLFMEGY